MNRNIMPLVLMLAAGAVTCVITFVRGYSLTAQMTILFFVLLLFYLLGNVLKWTLNYFESENERRNKENGEVIEKEAEPGAENRGALEAKESENKSLAG